MLTTTHAELQKLNAGTRMKTVWLGGGLFTFVQTRWVKNSCTVFGKVLMAYFGADGLVQQDVTWAVATMLGFPLSPHKELSLCYSMPDRKYENMNWLGGRIAQTLGVIEPGAEYDPARWASL